MIPRNTENIGKVSDGISPPPKKRPNLFKRRKKRRKSKREKAKEKIMEKRIRERNVAAARPKS